MWALIGFHILVVALSVGISLSLPMIAGNLLANWVRIENEGVFLVSIELIVAIVLIMLFNQLRLSIRNRRLARVAISAGLVSFTPNRSLHVKRSLRTVKERYETGKSLMVIGSTGLTREARFALFCRNAFGPIFCCSTRTAGKPAYAFRLSRALILLSITFGRRGEKPSSCSKSSKRVAKMSNSSSIQTHRLSNW